MNTSDSLAAALADRYRIDGMLGQGGMATVYRAYDRRHERDVAIKVLHDELAQTLGDARLSALLDRAIEPKRARSRWAQPSARCCVPCSITRSTGRRSGGSVSSRISRRRVPERR